MASYLDTLNDEQRKFVTHDTPNPTLLLAGAGAGKTLSICAKVQHLIHNGVESRRICVLTFTNKAANEINERVIKATKINPELAPTMSTIHSLALRFIRKNPAGFGLGPKISPADDYDQTKLLEAIVQRKEWDLNHYNLKEKVDFHRARGIGFRVDYTEEVHKAAQKAHAGYHAMDSLELEAWELFEQEKQKNNLVDFADMLYLVLRRMNQDSVWAGKVHRMFQHVLMDEAQDTNIPCFGVTNGLIAPDNPNLHIIGDLGQSIYSFNGAMPELILEYSRNWRGLTPSLYRLQRNHRSVSKVVDFANKIQALMVDSLPLQMVSHRAEQGDDTGAVRLIRAESTQDAAYNVVRQISDGRGTLRDYAILVRSSMQIREIEGALVSARIPYIVRGGRGLLQTEEIRDVLAYIRLACNPNDFSALMRASSAPKRGLGEVALEKIRTNANALYEGDLIRGCQKAGGKAEIFGNQMREIQNEVTNPLRALDIALATTMYKDYIRKKYAKDPEKAKNKLENIDRLRVMIEGMLADTDMTTEDLVFQLSMEKVPEDDERGAVTISTIHCVDPSTMIGIPNTGLQTIDAASRVLPFNVATLKRPAKAVERFEHPAQPCKSVTTNYGFNLIGAHHHHLMLPDLKSFAALKDLKEGDTLPIRLGIQCGDSTPPTPRQLALAEIMGMLVGDGSYNDTDDYTIQFTAGDKDVMGYFCGMIRSVFAKKVSISEFSDTRQQSYFCDKAIRTELFDLGLNYEKEDKKTVPASIFTSNPLVQAAFIRGLFEADGSVGREGAGDNGIRFVNTAPAVAYGAHLILTNLGILASCRLEREDTDTRKVIYSVTISGIDTQHYRNKIDFIAYRKRARLKALAEKSKGKTNVDYLPMPLAKELPVKLYATLKTHGLSLWKMRGIPFESVIRNAMYNNHGLSIRGAQIALAFLEDKFKDHPDFTQTIATLHEYTDHRIFFDTITEIKEVEPRPLLDIEVPETHSYWTNGFVSHNSAKGLEWKTVFVWSVVEGCLPHWRSSGDEKELTEERRLFYVAVTRARDFAYLCVPGKIPRGQNMSFAEMSRFLVELGVKP